MWVLTDVQGKILDDIWNSTGAPYSPAQFPLFEEIKFYAQEAYVKCPIAKLVPLHIKEDSLNNFHIDHLEGIL